MKKRKHMALPNMEDEVYDSLDSLDEDERSAFWEAIRSRSWKGWLALSISILIALLLLVFNVTASSGNFEGIFTKLQNGLQAEKVSEDAAVNGQEPDRVVGADEDTFEETSEEVPSDTMEMVEEDTIDEVEEATEEVVEEAEEVASESDDSGAINGVIWHYYNLDIQDDGIKENDYNFGPNPILDNISLDKVKTAVKGKKASDSIKVEEIVEMLDAQQVKAEQIKRMYDDPKLGAADMAWMDSIAGTRYLGVFYSAAKEQWDVAMNDAADTWAKDEQVYFQTLNAFENWLDSATEVKIEYRSKGLTDQMYMNPYTPSGVPDIIVMETSDHEGWFIVYKFTIKETKTFEVAYRIDCGFQPTNVAEIMKVHVSKNPNNQTKKKSNNKKKTTVTANPTPTGGDNNNPTPSGGGSDPNPSGDDSDPKPSGGDDKDPEPKPDPDKPDPTPTPPDPTPPDPTPPDPKPDPEPDPEPDPDKPDPKPDPDKPKDPSEGTQVQPNDDTGPGEDTNGGDKSSQEQDSNSGNMNQDEYKQAQDENKSANETSREGGDSNKPSTPTESDTHVDNNGDEGTGNGGIDEPTEVHDSSVSDDKPGDSWDGPPD